MFNRRPRADIDCQSTTLDVVFANTGQRFLVNQHADEDIEDAVRRTLREIPRGFDRLYTLQTVPVSRSFAAANPIDLTRRPDIDAEIDALELVVSDHSALADRYRVFDESLFGRVWRRHLRWYDEIRSTCLGNPVYVDLRHFRDQEPPPPASYMMIPVDKLRAMANYVRSYYDEEEKRQQRGNVSTAVVDDEDDDDDSE